MTKAISAAAAALVMAAVLSCSPYRVPKDFDEESREFYSTVRYIITKEERQAFLRLKPSERPPFIEEFWERRNPVPGAEQNKFREQYFRRIEEANRLFKEGSTPGWLQDRGEIYITLGPPDHRETYPRGTQFYGKPEEIWWYGFFPIVFVDDNLSGNYRLTPLGARHIAEIARAQAAETEPMAGMKREAGPSFDFEIAVEKADGRTVIAVKIPYKDIWFKAEGDTFYTTLEVSLTAQAGDGSTVWETTKDFKISVPRAKGLEFFEQPYEMRFVTALESGSYQVVAVITNRTGNVQSKKSFDIEL